MVQQTATSFYNSFQSATSHWNNTLSVTSQFNTSQPETLHLNSTISESSFLLTENVTLSVVREGGDLGISLSSVIIVSVLFCCVGLAGLVGNTALIVAVLADRHMRQSATNIFITNMALADLLIMIFGVPEVVQFIVNRGWLLGEVTCRLQRYVLVTSLYTSVATAVAVCIERFSTISSSLYNDLFELLVK